VLRAGVFLALTLLPPSAAAPGATPDQVFRDTIDVNEVLLDVVVESRDGTSGGGLRVADFQLIVDGKRTPITHFEEAGRVETGAVGAGDLVVLFVDNRHLPRELRDRALEQIGRPLAELLATGRRIMVITYDGRSRVAQPSTADPSALEAALARVRAEPVASEALISARSETAGHILATVRGLSRNSAVEAERTYDAMFSRLRGYADLEYRDAGSALQAMRLVLASLGSLAGSKSLLYLGDGLPTQPLDRVFDRFLVSTKQSQVDPTVVQSTRPLQAAASADIAFWWGQEWAEGYDDLDLTEEIISTAQVANTNRVTIYTVPVTENFRHEIDPSAAVYLGKERFPISNLDLALNLLARSTGGRSHDRGASVLEFVDQTAREIESRYSIGFVPRDLDSGVQHTVAVKVRRRGIEVRHRESFGARSFDQQLAARTIAALTLGLVANPQQLQFEMQGAKPIGSGRYETALLAHFPIAAISLVDGGAEHFADLRAAVAFLDADGGLGDVRQVEVPLRIPLADLDRALGQEFGAVLRLEMPPGRFPVAVGLWDRSTGHGSFVTGSVDVE
jgi:VWFA-related protein